MCLYFLDLLQYEHFRREIVNSQCVKFIDDQAILLWQHYTRRRMKLLAAAQLNQQQNQNQQQNPQNPFNGQQNQPLSNGLPLQNGTSSPVQNGSEPSGNNASGLNQR